MGVLSSTLQSARSLRSPAKLKRVAVDTAVILALLFAAAFVGLLCVFLPAILVVGMVMAVVFPLLAWYRPWVGVSLYVMVVLISPGQKIADVITFATMAIIGLKMLMEKPRVWPTKKVLLPYVIFMALLGLSLVLAFGLFRTQISYIYGDGRLFAYWLWLPLLYWMANREEDGTKKLARLMIFVAGAITVIVLMQWATGVQVVASGRVGSLETSGAIQGDLTRVQMPGFVFVMFGLVWSFVALAHGRRILLLIPVTLLLLITLYVNFGRALWVWTAVAVLLSLFLIGQRRAVPMLAVLLTVSLFVGGSLALFKPAVIDNVVTRLSSVQDEGGSRTSLGWRKLENDDAMARIVRSPLVGVGVGGEYRRWIAEIRAFDEHTRYVHNSYFFIALKLGVPALLALLTVLLVSWLRGRAAIARVSPDRRPLQIAAVAMLPAVLGLSVTQPELANANGPIFFSCLLVVLISDRYLPAESARRQGRSPALKSMRRTRRTFA